MSNDSDSDYEIKKTIGKGNFGKVLLGISKTTGEKVAIKIIDKLKMNKCYNTEQVRREIKVIQEMDHLNIVKIYKIENNSKKYKIIMEYCEKGELYEYIVQKKRLKEKEAAYYFFQLINGLEFIHSKNIVHRDLKPENLLITNENILKIIDFGLSNYHDINKLLSTPCGSPSYASPEMVSGNKYNGVLVDIWCTGIILFAMLSGYLPFEANDNYSLFKKIIKCEINYPKDISEKALNLMKKILVNEPSKRINIKQIKKHPFYLEGKKIFGGIHKKYLDILEASSIKKIYPGHFKFNKGEFNDSKISEKNSFFKWKKINLYKKVKEREKKPKKDNFEDINKKNEGREENKNIIKYDEAKNNFKEKIFKKKNFFINSSQKEFESNPINEKKLCFTEDNTEYNVIKYIKPIMSPKYKEKKRLFNDNLVNSSREKEKNLNFQGKYFNFKILGNIKNYSPPSNSLGPYKRPTLKDASVSLKKDYLERNNQRNTVSSKRPKELDNLYLDSINISERNSVNINKIPFNNRNDNLNNNTYIYKHKNFKTSALIDNKNIYEKKRQFLNNYNDDNYSRNNINNLNIYYTLNNSQSSKKQNKLNNNMLFQNYNKNENEIEKYLSNNYKNINSAEKTHTLYIKNQIKDKDLIYQDYYGNIIADSDNKNKYNYIKKNIKLLNKQNTYKKSINTPNKNNEFSNNSIFLHDKKSKLLNNQRKIFIKKKIKNDESSSNKHSSIINNINRTNIDSNILANLSELPIKKKKIRALIFNNQINQLNIYKNNNNINSYEINPIFIYNNSQALKTVQNELNISPTYKVQRQFKTIINNEKCPSENNYFEYQSIPSKINNINRKIYKKNENKNYSKDHYLNNGKIRRQKGNLLNSLFDNEKSKSNRKSFINQNKSLKSSDNNHQKINENDKYNFFIKSDNNKKRKKNVLIKAIY